MHPAARLGVNKERFLTLSSQYGDTSGTISLLGTWKGKVFTRGKKFFELSNHLGNVLVTITDRKQQVPKNDTLLKYYEPDVATANDYYPFGMLQPGRKYSAAGTGYRYGFNGKENDNEVKGEGNQQDYGMRIYDPRLGRFLSVDPLLKEYPWYTPYQYAGNIPIRFIDRDGKEPSDPWDDLWAGRGDQVKNIEWVIRDFFTGRGNVTKAASSFDRSVNPLRITADAVYGGFTGKDLETGAPVNRGQAVQDGVAKWIMLLAGPKLKMSPALQMENQLTVNSMAVSKTATQQSASQITKEEKQKLTAYIQQLKSSSNSSIKSVNPKTFIRTETPSGNQSARSVGANIKLIDEGKSLAPIEVADINGKLYVINGHHRVEAALRAGTDLRYKVLSKDEWKAYGYDSESSIVQAAAEAAEKKVNLNNRIIQKEAGRENK